MKFYMFLLGAFLVITGCSKSNDSNPVKAVNDDVVVYTDLNAEIFESGLDFGLEELAMAADLGKTVKQTIVFYNRTTLKKDMSRTLSDEVEGLVITSSCGDELKGRGSCLLTLTFAPQEVLSESITLSILDSFITINLDATSAQPATISDRELRQIRVSPLVVDLGKIEAGESASRSLSVVNNNSKGTYPIDGSGSSIVSLTNGTCGETLLAKTACSVSVSVTAPAEVEESQQISESIFVINGVEVSVQAEFIPVVNLNACLESSDITVSKTSLNVSNSNQTLKVQNNSSKVGKVCFESSENMTVTGCEDPIGFRGSCTLTVSNTGEKNVSEVVTIAEGIEITVVQRDLASCVVPAASSISEATGIDNTNGKVSKVLYDNANLSCVVQSCATGFTANEAKKACVAVGSPPEPTLPRYDSGLEYDSGVVYQ